MEKRTTNKDKNPLPPSNSVLAIEMLDPEGQEAREGTSDRAHAKHHGDADLHGMALVKVETRSIAPGRRPPKGHHQYQLVFMLVENTFNSAKEESTHEKTVVGMDST